MYTVLARTARTAPTCALWYTLHNKEPIPRLFHTQCLAKSLELEALSYIMRNKEPKPEALCYALCMKEPQNRLFVTQCVPKRLSGRCASRPWQD